MFWPVAVQKDGSVSLRKSPPGDFFIIMKKQYRVTDNRDFQKIIGNKKYVASRSYVIYYRQGTMDHARFGISVSKKLGNAVFRNLYKRQVRMMLQQTAAFSHPMDLIIILRKGYCARDFAENKKDLENLLKKVKMNNDTISKEHI